MLDGNPKQSMECAQRCVSDFSLTWYDNHPVTPGNQAALHAKHRDAIHFWTKCSTLPVVVVTHFLPSPKSIAPQYAHDALNPYFASDCEDLMDGDTIPLWIHGHTHTSCDYKVFGTRVVCNPRGYTDRENSAFNPQLVVEV